VLMPFFLSQFTAIGICLKAQQFWSDFKQSENANK
jgi:hypothetical protein